MPILEQLQNSGFSTWVSGSDSILAYPTILTLHTIGLGIVVGAALVLDLRLLGTGADIPLPEMRTVFRFFWVGFVINLLSGLALFAAEATEKATQPVFFVKLAFIAAAVVITVRIRRVAFGDGTASPRPASSAARRLAGVSLVLWTGAIFAGRLMAYIK